MLTRSIKIIFLLGVILFPLLSRYHANSNKKYWIDTLHEKFQVLKDARKKNGYRSLNFRTVKSKYAARHKIITYNPDRTGLEDLRLSGSSQLSEEEIIALSECFHNNMQLFLVDLRYERHGFLDDHPVRYFKSKDKFIIRKDLKNDVRCFIYLEEENLIRSEEEIANQYDISNIRLRVKHHKIDNPENIDKFISLVDRIRSHGDEWIHLHCAAGWNRTAIYMIMMDMLINAHQVSKTDILMRQYCLGGDNFFEKDLSKPNRIFLDKFYEFSLARMNGSYRSWSEFIEEREVF